MTGLVKAIKVEFAGVNVIAGSPRIAGKGTFQFVTAPVVTSISMVPEKLALLWRTPVAVKVFADAGATAKHIARVVVPSAMLRAVINRRQMARSD